jgi:CheY-like chemotaxis protein
MTSGQPKTILIVEDDELQRMHLVSLVEDAGLVPLEAGTADEAVLILERRTDIAAVVTDVTMPGSMDGVKLALAVRDRWPPIKIIVMSGKELPGDPKLPEGSRFFSKPFEGVKLVAELRSMIAA